MHDLVHQLTQLDPAPEDSLAGLDDAADDLRRGLLASPRPATSRPARARPGRWLAVAAAAVAVVTSLALLWPRAGAGPLPAEPAASPSDTASASTAGLPRDTWVRIAASPLSPRHAAVTAWVAGVYLVLGGDETAPCPATADCIEPEHLVADGARYDPVADAWTPIAEAPVAVANASGAATPYPRSAVLAGTLYLLSERSMLAYDVASDSWRELPLPSNSPVLTLVALDSGLAAFGYDAPKGRYRLFDPGTGEWSDHRAADLPGPVGGATVAAGRLVVSGLVDGDLTRQWVALLDPATGATTRIDDPGLEPQRPTPLGLETSAGGFAVWARARTEAWFLDPATQRWDSVAVPEHAGALSGRLGMLPVTFYVTVAGMLSLNGHLYDPVSGLWSATPDLPLPSDSPVLAAGGDTVLACYGYVYSEDAAEAGFGDDCYLLRPGPATRTAP